MDELYDIAVCFREAINEALKDGWASRIWLLRSFPVGCCTYASDLLQRYLIEHGVYARNVSGDYRRGRVVESHSWLETEDGTVIDITVDQYRGGNLPVRSDGQVYVGERDEFHKLFEPLRVCEYSLDSDPLGNTQRQIDFDAFYAAVVAHMDDLHAS